jgi:plastocyanin
METIKQGHSGLKMRVALAAAAATAIALMAFFAIGLGNSAGAATATASGSKTVTINHFKFMPSNLHVTKGTRVVFSNTSGVTHTATLKGSFNTGNIRPGKAVAVKFTATGTYSYHCTIHPEMHGKITVG